MAVFCRNRRAHSETDPVSGTIERDCSSDPQRSHSTSDLTSGRIDENSLFDISPLPLDLSERVRGSDGAHEAPCFLESTLQIQRVSTSCNVNEFDRNGQQQQSSNQPHRERVNQLSETESMATNHSQGTANVRPKYNNLSDFLDEILEIDTSEGRYLNVPARQQIAMEVSSALSNPTFDLSNSLTTTSAVSCTTNSNVTPCVTWSNQSCVLYSSCRNSFDYHSHSHLDQNLNCALRNPPSGPEVIAKQYSLPTDHLGKPQPMVSGENRFPSCSHMGEGDSCQANPSVNFRDSVDPRQRPQCLLPVQRIRREALEYAGHYLLRRRSNVAGPGVSSKLTNDGPRQREHRPGFDTGKTHGRTRSDGKAGSFGESWTENSDVKNKEVGKKELPTRKFAHSEQRSPTDATPKLKSEVEDASPKQGSSTPTSNTTNMLLGVDDMAMLSEDQVSLLRQLEEDKSLLFDFEMFQGSAVTSEPDMNIITGPNRSLLAQPMTPPGGNNSEPDGMMSPGSDLQALENYYPASQPSPASTVVSEQEMIEAYELVMEEVLTTIIRRLGISADPYQWTCEHVQAWISLLHQEYGRPEVNLLQFQVDGYTLCRMSQEDLEQRAPESGYLLHSNLNCLLKMNQMEDIKPIISQCQQQQHQQHQQHHHQQQQQQQYQAQTMAPHPMGYDANIMYQFSMPPMAPSSPAMLSEKDLGPSSVGSSASSDEDEQSMTSPVPSPSGPNTSMTPHHTGAIQLWQFLQELLLQPDSYNYCIRFLDRTQGIFKIEDSVEVARLWGMRKNRPAMNYDKLSRSIRQYYKKGIMKKTEISQRLVYQFVKPF